jgi:phosphate transport system substrate-binding protein
MTKNRIAVLLAALGLSLFAGCGESSGTVVLQGAGATFPNPLYQRWCADYNKTHPSVSLDYQSIGSGGGIKQLSARTVDFGGSDAPMTNEEIKGAGADVIHIPTVLGADVLTYNLPDVQADLKLTPEAVADIFLGKIKKWDDPALKATNPGVALPSKEITVVHRSDGSGTTYVWTDYLSKVSPEWKEKVGVEKSVNWPVGVGAKGNEGVSGQVKQTPYSAGYVELQYAEQNKMPYASIKNSAGEFIRPNLDSISAAAAGASAQMPEDLRVSITNAPGAAAYPAASFTYLLVYKEQSDEGKGKALVDFLWWAIHDGQATAKEMIYAPLPKEVVVKTEAKIKLLTSQGKPLHTN